MTRYRIRPITEGGFIGLAMTESLTAQRAAQAAASLPRRAGVILAHEEVRDPIRRSDKK